jgi:carbamoyltransferase
MNKPIYVLGTHQSHDGSACLLKDGRICAAIEKERITRKKHDGHQDADAILYCLEKEKIQLNDLDLIVQNAQYGSFYGERLITENCPIPVVTISHHLAHAYSAIGPCNFDKSSVLVIDGAGNRLDSCTDLPAGEIPFINAIDREAFGCDR